MFQYAFAKGYASAMNCDLQTPDWWGRKVFPEAARDPLIDRYLPQTHCDSVVHHIKLPLGYFIGSTDIDLNGYFQHQVFINFYSRTQARNWFSFAPDIYEPYKPAPGESWNAKHLRRGDMSDDATFQKLYCTVSDQSYITAEHQFNIQSVEAIWDGCDNPDPLEVKLGIGWLSDFLFLRDAAILLRANSTFSWWAGALGKGKVYSPVVGNKVGLNTVPFVEGNHPNTAGIFPNQSDLFLKE